MAKKATKITSKKKKSVSKLSVPKVSEENNAQKILTENFISLQSVMAGLSSKLNDLTEKVSKLLDLFEESAKTLAEKGGVSELGQNKEVSDKLNKLMDQNRVMAQGIALLHETNQNQPEQEEQPNNEEVPMNQPPQQDNQIQGANQNRYQKSISSKY